jgi:hypothetical protein
VVFSTTFSNIIYYNKYQFSQVRPPLAKPDQTGVPNQMENENVTVFQINNLKTLIKPM